MSVNPYTCACQQQQYGPIIFDTVSYQNSANTIYNAKSATLAAATVGSLTSPNGNPIFKSQYERMQYLLGKIGADGIKPKINALGTN